MSCSCKLFCCKLLLLFYVFTEQINDDDDDDDDGIEDLRVSYLMSVNRK